MSFLLSADHILPLKSNLLLLSQTEHKNAYFSKTKKAGEPGSVHGSRLRQSEPALSPVQSDKPPTTSPAKADRTQRAFASRIIVEMYGTNDPDGVTDKDLLNRVNARMKEKNRKSI